MDKRDFLNGQWTAPAAGAAPVSAAGILAEGPEAALQRMKEFEASIPERHARESRALSLGKTAATAFSAPAGKTATSAYNRVLPKRAANTAGLEAYTGTFGNAQAAHLLRRTIYGPTRAEIVDTVKKGLNATVDTLLNTPYVSPNGPCYQEPQAIQDQALPFHREWLIMLMLEQRIDLRYKMFVFWGNHYGYTENNYDKVIYAKNRMLLENALGNYKDLTKKVSLDPCMLQQLTGTENRKDHPNENYARELLELYSIGKGKLKGPGDYTHYTEDDVQAAARLLTGYTVDWQWDSWTVKPKYKFNAHDHDATDKKFSAAFGNRVITGRTGADGEKELDDLLGMIFDQKECARYVCRRLYRFFVYYVIDDTVERNIIEPLATALYNAKYDMKVPLALLFKSAHFFHAENLGSMEKSPVDFVLAVPRQLENKDKKLARAGTEAYEYQPGKRFPYGPHHGLRILMADLQQTPCDTPSVAGWPAYYQAPAYYQFWLNSTTFPTRQKIISWYHRDMQCPFDLVETVKGYSKPADADALLDDLALVLLPFPLDAQQKTELKAVLAGNLPGYQWDVQWNDMVKNPADAMKKEAINKRLFEVVTFFSQMAEYQLM